MQEKNMRNTLQFVTGAALAAAFGIASAQMTPALPNSPATPTTPGTSTRTDSSTSASGSSATASNQTFIGLDADKNGSVSKKEASSNKSLTAKWDTLDANKDGTLDQGEFARFESSSSTVSPKY
jgi:hypothetical protein